MLRRVWWTTRLFHAEGCECEPLSLGDTRSCLWRRMVQSYLHLDRSPWQPYDIWSEGGAIIGFLEAGELTEPSEWEKGVQDGSRVSGLGACLEITKKWKRNSNFLGRNITFNLGMLSLKRLCYQKKLYMGQFTDNSGNLGNTMLNICPLHLFSSPRNNIHQVRQAHGYSACFSSLLILFSRG